MSTPILAKLRNYGQEGLRHPIRGHEIGALVQDYDSLLDLFPVTDTPAVCEPSNPEKQPLTHRRLRQFLEHEVDLREFGIAYRSRVAVLLANGPELVVTMLAVMSHWCAAPINPTNTWQEMKSELKSTRAVAMIILAGASTNEAALKAAEETGVAVISISPLGKTKRIVLLVDSHLA